MKKEFLLFILALSVLSCRQPASKDASVASLASGKIDRYENFGSRFVSARNVDVWLPDGYSPSSEYAVLYMHDGQMLFDSTATWNKQEWGVDETVGRLIKEDSIQPCIVVAIWNTGLGRHSDYYPQKPFERLPAGYRDSLLQLRNYDKETRLLMNGVQSDNYLKFIVRELKPFIDSVYATRKDREHTFIMGSSMGGLISMYALCEYPEVFGGAACLSTHWQGLFEPEFSRITRSFVQYLDAYLPDPSTHRIYFDYGTETLDAQYEPSQMLVDSILVKKGYDASNWETLKFEGKDHSERAWGERLSVPVKFLLGK